MNALRHNRALALLVALFFEMLLFLLVMAFFQLVPLEFTSARREHTRAQSYYFGNAMAQAISAWLSHSEDISGNPLQGLSGESTGNVAWPRRYALTSANVPGLQPHPLDSRDWSARLWLYPDTRTEAREGPHVFKLRVISDYQGQAISAHEYLLQQQTFAKYGFFVDRPPQVGFYTAMRNDVYEGEFHVNGKLPLYVDPTLFSSFVAPVFRNEVSFTRADSANPFDGITYQSGSAKPYDAAGNPIVDADGRDRYSKLCTLGRAAIRLENDVPMPSTDLSTDPPLAKAAWFGRNSRADSLATAAIASGVNLRRLEDGTLSGVYIRGDVREMVLGVQDGTGAAVLRNANGTIDSGISAISVLSEADARAGLQRTTKVLELRDPALPLQVPAGSRLAPETGPAYVTSEPLLLSGNYTVVVRAPGTPGNTGPETLYQLFQGYPNGVVYVDGNIGRVPLLDGERAGGSSVNRDYMRSGTDSVGGLKGVNYGARRTIAVNSARNNYVRLQGNITRGDVAPGQAATGRRDGLGIVGYDVIVGREIPRRGDTEPFYLYSLLFAGRRDTSGVTQSGSVIYESWDSISGWGRLFSFGSYVVGNDRLWGDNGTKGWMPTFRHDSVLASSPPPFYPTRGDYKLQSFQEVQAR